MTEIIPAPSDLKYGGAMQIAGALVVLGAVVLMARQVEVRLVLLGAGFLLCLLAGQPLLLVDTFAHSMVASLVAPICAAMAFASLLRATGCDRHLVALLVTPLRQARPLLLVGGIVAAYLVNLAVPSQTSTAAAMGPILFPLLRSAGYSALTAAAALVLGSSFGGDLLNPGAQDVQAISAVAHLQSSQVNSVILGGSAFGLLVAALTFHALHYREAFAGPAGEQPLAARIQWLKALMPLVPVTTLMLAQAGLPALQWLVEVPEGGLPGLPVVRAMLLGSACVAATCYQELSALMREWFEAMGRAYASIISLTITAQCFGAGLGACGLVGALLAAVRTHPDLATPLAVLFPWSLALLSGSGSGSVVTFGQTFLAHLGPELEPNTLAALACMSAAIGRTMSPVAAVVIYASTLAEVSPLSLVRRLAPALLVGAATALALAWQL